MKTIGIVSGDYFMQNLYWIIAVCVVGVILVYFLLSHFLHHKRQATPAVKPDQGKYLTALGGSENIISHEMMGSRIIVVLRDYSKINRPLLEEAGVTGFIEKSDKLTLVIKDHCQEVYQTIFPN
jgi:Phosphotransferase system IIB components